MNRINVILKNVLEKRYHNIEKCEILLIILLYYCHITQLARETRAPSVQF